MTKKKVLFVCLGNICRSPIAEGVFLYLIKQQGIESNWEVDSAATAGYHTGSSPDERALTTMKKHNISYNNTARQIEPEDFIQFDYIFGMDNNNIRNLNEEAKSVTGAKAKIMLLGEYDPEGNKIIRDPYYDQGSKGFETCYEQCMRCCKAFLESLN